MNTLTRDEVTLRPRPRGNARRRLLLLLGLLLLLAGGGVLSWRLAALLGPGGAKAPGGEAPGGEAAAEPIPVLLAPVRRQDVPIYLDGLGSVQASQTVTVKAQVDGKLVEVDFREGQDVRRGDLLARIDPRTYQAALDQAVAKKQQDEANLANARLDLARYRKLAAQAYTSAQTSDTQRATVAQMQAQVAGDQAQIDSARAQLSFCTIAAPIDGRAGIRQVDQGNIVHAADTTGIVVLTTLRPIAVLFTLPQQDLPQVAAAMAGGSAVVDALPQDVAMRPDAAPLDRGTLSVLDNQVDPSTGTIKLKALFPNPRLALWPGAFTTVRLLARIERAAIVVPEAALQRGPDGAYVYVVGADLVAVRRAVTVGHEDGAGALIASGAQPGERVVVDGAARLEDGTKVSLAEPPERLAPPASRR